MNKFIHCAKEVADGNLELADFLFCEMEDLMVAETSEVTKKVVKYFAEGLVRRVHGVYPRNPMPLIPLGAKLYKTYDNENSPFYIFASITTQHGILEALPIGSSKPFHFIDFFIMAGPWYWNRWMVRYAGLIGPATLLRLTSIRPKLSENDEYLQESQRKFAEFARCLGVDFDHRELVAENVTDITESVLKIRRSSEGEFIVVRWAFELHKLLALEGAIEKVLSKLRDLKPDIMIVIEQEANHNCSDFFTRLTSSFEYYYSVFESLERFTEQPCTRMLLEKQLKWQINNVVATKGIDRIERHETLTCWKERLRQAGFQSVQLWSSKLKDCSLTDFPEFRIGQNNGFPTLCLPNRPVAVVSVWKPDNRTQLINNIGTDHS